MFVFTLLGESFSFLIQAPTWNLYSTETLYVFFMAKTYGFACICCLFKTILVVYILLKVEIKY